ncbi:mitochondrial import inner membrane translocase, subunit Tim21, partial [Myriangium duriaei CBS 260.36]
GVGYVLYVEVFSPSSKTAVFNRTVSRIKADPASVDALVGDDRGARIAAYGEGSWSRWARNRTIASTLETDQRGVEHLRMHFYVAGPKAEGTVWVHMTRHSGGDWEYHTLALDVKGEERLWLENAEKSRSDGVKGGKMFGVRWW